MTEPLTPCPERPGDASREPPAEAPGASSAHALRGAGPGARREPARNGGAAARSTRKGRGRPPAKSSRGGPRSCPPSRSPRPGPGPGEALSGPLAPVFVKRAGRYHLRLEAFAGAAELRDSEWAAAPRLRELARAGADPGGAPPAPDPPSASARASDSDTGGHPILTDLGREGQPPDDLLRAAAAAGATANPAFLDILDGGDFEPAPCLCCYAAESPRGARKAAQSLMLFQRYYQASSYLESRAFPRMVQTLARDAQSPELAVVKMHLLRLECATDELRAINSHPAICVAAPRCRPDSVWVYATPAARKMLRHVARQFRGAQGGLSLTVSVASSDPEVHPRWRYRMYSAALVRSGRGPEEPAAAGAKATLLAAMRDWVAAAAEPRPAPSPARAPDPSPAGAAASASAAPGRPRRSGRG